MWKWWPQREHEHDRWDCAECRMQFESGKYSATYKDNAALVQVTKELEIAKTTIARLLSYGALERARYDKLATEYQMVQNVLRVLNINIQVPIEPRSSEEM